MQLIALGAQDLYLTSNPQITFFKTVYRRHTNFSIQTMEHTMGGNPDFGRKSMVTILRTSDLVYRAYLRVTIGATDGGSGSVWGYVDRLGHAIIKSVEIEIGGSKIDKHYGVWLDVWYELTRNSSHDEGYKRMIGCVPELTDVKAGTKPEYTLYVPLQFWFCRTPGNAIPSIALQFHESRMHFEWEYVNKLVNYRGTMPTGIHIRDACLLVDHIFLDNEERFKYAQLGHEYLFEQLQFLGEESATETMSKIKLNFNHPTKEIVWVTKNGRFSGERYLGMTVDEAAIELVKAQVVLGAVGTTVTLNGNNIDSVGGVDNDKITLLSGSAPISLLSNVDSDNTADVGGLYSKIVAATVMAQGPLPEDIHVVSVTHNITIQDLLPLSSIKDGRALSHVASKQGDGVTVNLFSNYGMYLDGSCNPTKKALIQFNGHDRFEEKSGEYFNYVQPYQHHSNTPKDGINTYSFALKPEEHQPSGSANLSRIDNTQLNITYNPGFPHHKNRLHVFAFSYNTLRIIGGLCGVAFSN